jgi:hypothetical protein
MTPLPALKDDAAVEIGERVVELVGTKTMEPCDKIA